MTRIIQDSDDEEEESLEEHAENAMGVPQVDNASSGELNPVPNAEHGTGSTESLKNAIEAAHRAHFTSQPSPLIPSIPQRDTEDLLHSSEEHRSKRRKTSADTVSHMSPVMDIERKKPSIMYTRSKTLHSSPLIEKLWSTESEQQGHDEDTIWALDGTLRVDYEQHEPMALFPEASSTVPNATATQERLFAEVMAPGFLGLDGDSEMKTMPHQPQGSVPWSELMKTPSENTQTHFEPPISHGQGLDVAEHHSQSHTPPGSPDLPPQNISQTPRRTQRKRQGSVRLSGSPLRNEVRLEDIATPSHKDMQRDSDEHTTARGLLSIDSGRSSSHISNELSRPHSTTCGDESTANEATTTVASSRNVKAATTSDNDVDTIDTDLPPQDQYKPRPSRSRSMKHTTEGPVDHSVRPEKAAKKSTRRSRTTGGISSSNVAPTPQQIRQICDMGFTPSTAQKALEKNNGDINSTVDWLVSNGATDEQDEQDELAPKRAQVKRRKTTHDAVISDTIIPHIENERTSYTPTGKPQAKDSVDEEEVAASNPTVEPPNECSEPKGSPKVVILNSKTKKTTSLSNVEVSHTKTEQSQKIDPTEDGTDRRIKRRKTAPDQPEQEPPKAEIVDTPTEKRKGRGRPRKNPNPPAVAEIICDDAPPERLDGEQNDESLLREVKPTSTIELSEIKDMAGEPSTTLGQGMAPPESTPPTKESPAVKTPEKGKDEPANGVHSPLSKGKVSYRVGLSKRARIAPLLKMVKK